jgi:hypothetical protein
MMKRLTMLVIALALAAAAIHAQEPPKKSDTQCRDLSETNNMVGSDEVLVNGKVCKKAFLTTASQVEAPKTPPVGGRNVPVQAPDDSKTGKQSEEASWQQGASNQQSGDPLTNDSIVKLVAAGLGEDTIVTIVERQTGNYSLNADNIIALKKAGVSEKVITAMLKRSGNALTPRPATSTRTAQDVIVPLEPGLYALLSEGALRHIAGRPTSFIRTGSRLASDLTVGIHANRMNTQIAGKSAYVTVGPHPTFYYRVTQNAQDHPDQVVPGTLNLILTQMTIKSGRRQFELDANGVFRRSQGISARHQGNFDALEIEPGLYQLNPDDLKPGQYAFFLYIGSPERATTHGGAGGEALRGFIFDFQVE